MCVEKICKLAQQAITIVSERTHFSHSPEEVFDQIITKKIILLSHCSSSSKMPY